MLGTWLRRTAPEGVALTPVVHRRPLSDDRRTGGSALAADLRDPARVDEAVHEVRPDLVVHAAYAKDRASIVDATAHLTRAAQAVGAGLIFVSTDAVFSGDGRPRSETDRPDPIADYGRWKAEAESIVVAAGSGNAVVRLPLVLSVEPEDHVVGEIRRAVDRGERSTWFTDEFRQPANAPELAAAIWAIAGLPVAERAGAWHLPGPERLARDEIAERAARAAGIDADAFRAAPTPSDADRPRDLHLTDARARDAIGWDPTPIHGDQDSIGGS